MFYMTVYFQTSNSALKTKQLEDMPIEYTP